MLSSRGAGLCGWAGAVLSSVGFVLRMGYQKSRKQPKEEDATKLRKMR